jgi:hypothetical protein
MSSFTYHFITYHFYFTHYSLFPLPHVSRLLPSSPLRPFPA